MGQAEFFLWIDRPALKALHVLASRHSGSVYAEARALIDEGLQRRGLLPVAPSRAAEVAGADVDANAEQRDDCHAR